MYRNKRFAIRNDDDVGGRGQEQSRQQGHEGSKTSLQQNPTALNSGCQLMQVVVVKYTDIAVRSLTCHTATGTHMPRRITQCYLSPDRGDIPTFTPAEAGIRLSDPGGMQG